MEIWVKFVHQIRADKRKYNFPGDYCPRYHCDSDNMRVCKMITSFTRVAVRGSTDMLTVRTALATNGSMAD